MKNWLFLSLVCLFSSTIYAQKKEFKGGLYWELNGDVLTISGNGGSYEWNSPWKSYSNEIKKVIIENGVRRIGKWAFSHCKNLSDVKIPLSVTSINDYAFYSCTSLKSIVIPNSVTSIESGAFSGCSSLSSLTVPYGAGKYFGQDWNICTLYRAFDGPNQTTYYIVERGDQWGVKSAERWYIPLGNAYSNLVPLEGKYLKVEKNGRSGLITIEGNEIVGLELEALEKCGTGFLRFKINGFWGVMNYQGKIIIPTERGYTKIGDYVSFTKRFPYEMDGYKGECNNLGIQVSKIKVGTPKPANTTNSTSSNSSNSSTSSNTSSNNNNSQNKTTTVVVEHHRDPAPVQEWQACFGCGGMGTMGCDNCGGGGTKYIGDRLYRCSRCNGRGIIPCNVCSGKKGQYITVYR